MFLVYIWKKQFIENIEIKIGGWNVKSEFPDGIDVMVHGGVIPVLYCQLVELLLIE